MHRYIIMLNSFERQLLNYVNTCPLFAVDVKMQGIWRFQEVFPCFVFFIFLFTVHVTLPCYFNPYFWTKETLSFLVPQLAETFIEDVWHRLEVDFRSGSHTLAFLHIQKTGGKEFAVHFQSLQKKWEPLCHLKKRITNYSSHLNSGNCVIDPPQSKEMWLVSETTYGWPCGVHPFLTDFKSCLPNFLKTILVRGIVLSTIWHLFAIQ